MDRQKFSYYVEILLEEFEKGSLNQYENPEKYIVECIQNYLEKHKQAE